MLQEKYATIRQPFSFSKINGKEILKKILELETSKAFQDTKTLFITTKIIKENADIFADILLAKFNDSVEKSFVHPPQKKENVTAVFKKGDRNADDNYRPVSTPPNMFKIFERFIFCQ